jgi:hypothetical protein
MFLYTVGGGQKLIQYLKVELDKTSAQPKVNLQRRMQPSMQRRILAEFFMSFIFASQ